MAKKTEESVVEKTSVHIQPVSIDYGREDINNLAKKVNEIIEHLNNV